MSSTFLQEKITERKAINAFRALKTSAQSIDFCSNDYLGVTKNKLIKLNDSNADHGSTGSRLLSGNYRLI